MPGMQEGTKTVALMKKVNTFSRNGYIGTTGYSRMRTWELMITIIDHSWDIECQYPTSISYIANVHIKDHAVILAYTGNGSGRNDMAIEKFKKAAGRNEDSK